MTTTDPSIGPFQVRVPDQDLADLRRRLAALSSMPARGKRPQASRNASAV
jgi:hypothetical protein